MASKPMNVYYLHRYRTPESNAGTLAGYGLFACMAIFLIVRVLVALSEVRHHGVGI